MQFCDILIQINLKSMIISCIVATDRNGVIGKDNEIPWYLPADLQYFKQKTLGHHVIMGRNCYVSIGRPLPKRTNIIVSRDIYFISSSCLVARSIQEALQMAHEHDETEVFIIGGGQIYEQTKELWDRLYLTEVDLEADGDVYFPKINEEEWRLLSSEKHEKDEKNPFNYTFKILEKK
jgi:dihydrofolate reductase